MSESPAPPVMLRFGSWWGRLITEHPEYTDAVRLIFGAEVYPLAPRFGPRPHFDCRIIGPEHGDPTPAAPVPSAGMLLGEDGDRRTVTTEALHAEIRRDRTPTQLVLWVRRPEFPTVELQFHFSVVFHKILFLVDRVILHGAAVRWDDTVNLFVGEKGAGKSTICLALAQAGATVLGEDRLVLKHSEQGFLVSGGDERSRLTERTERHFFAEPLRVTPRDFAGTLKKEIRLGDYFPSRPFEDFPPDRLFFPRVAGRFQLTRLKAQPALLRLMGYTAHYHRFAGSKDQEKFFELLADFIATVPAYQMELSSDLGDLARLGEQLRVA